MWKYHYFEAVFKLSKAATEKDCKKHKKETESDESCVWWNVTSALSSRTIIYSLLNASLILWEYFFTICCRHNISSYTNIYVYIPFPLLHCKFIACFTLLVYTGQWFYLLLVSQSQTPQTSGGWSDTFMKSTLTSESCIKPSPSSLQTPHLMNERNFSCK